MRQVELRGIVLKILKQGIHQTIVIFKDNHAGDVILAVNRTHKLFYEIRENMVLSLLVSINGFTDKQRKVRNGLSIESYEILNIEAD